ncbi:lipid A disaccharide synthetase related enzyme [Geminocystis sp. NIES-3708]|uniref:lipid-A-disaccharide synthase-related protein n=1 Tax=Geminocystis sp. NIES-3708 TaxID=1615909 RepID=UPI0005FC7C1F|nr:lipid-A-disaccharide synthase-related protein [Geminocystis sp. NIES-3708]BAQ62579.1 lipid A disaccharide synthetase related enzyme [Geminocystis sp. NIES-3708]
MNLLIISNGHGEDLIAIKIINQLRQINPQISITCLPMVGEGYAYVRENISFIAPVKKMPSGGFIYMDNKQLWRDINNGLISLTLTQFKAVKLWAKNDGYILAVGDILPLLCAWLSGAKYSFIGTAKSEYYLRNEDAWLENISKIDRYFGSIYYPWERWLMKNNRCFGVFPRDSITAQSLQEDNICAYDLGNPMMDDLTISSLPSDNEDSLKILLLPGSRLPEALDNWQLILQAVESIIDSKYHDLTFVAAITPSLSLSKFTELLSPRQWQENPLKSVNTPINDSQIMVFTKKGVKLILSQNAYDQCLNYCDMSIAMAGTATEQFVGLGKPVIAFPGNGPQYNQKFAENQARLLGISLQLVNHPQEAGKKIQDLLSTPDLLHSIATNGKKRLGETGAAKRIAEFIIKKIDLLTENR